VSGVATQSVVHVAGDRIKRQEGVGFSIVTM
jgi:hypothetical protein